MVNLVKGYAAYLEGRWKNAWELFCLAEKITKEECVGLNQGFASRGLDNTLFFALRSLFYLGDINGLLAKLPELLKEAKYKGNLYVLSNLKIIALYIKHLAADEVDKAQQELGAESDFKTIHRHYLARIIAQGEIALYSQSVRDAWEHINQQWPVLKKAMILESQISLIEALQLQARTALAVSQQVSDPATYLVVAEKNAKRILREKTPYGDGWAALLLAGVAATRGKVERAITYLNSAAKNFENADMELYAAATRRRLGALLAGDEGSLLIELADSWMVNQKIKNPERMTNMLAPGRWSQ
jgi:eukaryotic-like serine/threonine-protein kinase